MGSEPASDVLMRAIPLAPFWETRIPRIQAPSPQPARVGDDVRSLTQSLNERLSLPKDLSSEPPSATWQTTALQVGRETSVSSSGEMADGIRVLVNAATMLNVHRSNRLGRSVSVASVARWLIFQLTTDNRQTNNKSNLTPPPLHTTSSDGAVSFRRIGWRIRVPRGSGFRRVRRRFRG